MFLQDLTVDSNHYKYEYCPWEDAPNRLVFGSPILPPLTGAPLPTPPLPLPLPLEVPVLEADLGFLTLFFLPTFLLDLPPSLPLLPPELLTVAAGLLLSSSINCSCLSVANVFKWSILCLRKCLVM